MVQQSLTSIASFHIESLGKGPACRSLLSEEATLTFMDTCEQFVGPDAICAVFDNLHVNLFKASSRPRSFLESNRHVAVEATFMGTHAREFAGLQPTGKSVTADYVLAYDVDDGRIAAIRAYWNLDALVQQLRGG